MRSNNILLYARFVEDFRDLSRIIQKVNIDNGFDTAKVDEGKVIALIHSEVSEALEALRQGNPTDSKVPEFTSLEVELADAIIRIMDFGAARGDNIGGAVVAKLEYNRTRSYKHGKEF